MFFVPREMPRKQGLAHMLYKASGWRIHMYEILTRLISGKYIHCIFFYFGYDLAGFFSFYSGLVFVVTQSNSVRQGFVPIKFIYSRQFQKNFYAILYKQPNALFMITSNLNPTSTGFKQKYITQVNILTQVNH